MSVKRKSLLKRLKEKETKELNVQNFPLFKEISVPLLPASSSSLQEEKEIFTNTKENE